MPGGLTAGGAISIDSTGAGWGWTVSGGQLDLYSVATHELGHVLGLEHEVVGLMVDMLSVGETESVVDRAHAAAPRRASLRI